MSIFQSYAMILKEKNSYRLWAIDIQEKGVAMIFSLRKEKKINSFGFSVSDGIKYFPHLYIKGCRRVSFSSLLPFQVNKKKNKYKFIQCSMVVFVLCSVSHIYIFQVILCVMEKGEWDCWLGVECSLHFSHFSFYCSYLLCNI